VARHPRVGSRLEFSRLKLVIANKNYSSWSMRPWVLLREAQIPFEEVQLKFGDDGKPLDVARY